VSATGGVLSAIADAHIETIAREGAVWLGVIGKRLSAANLQKLKTEGKFLYLVQWTGGHPDAYQGDLVGVAEDLPPLDQYLTPDYYAEEGVFASVKFWIKLSSLRPIGSEELGRLSVLSTGTRVTALCHSMTSMAILGAQKSPPSLA
jgi:hypothetical protein